MRTGDATQGTPLNNLVLETPKPERSGLPFKIFIVVVVIFAAIGIIVGVLALLAHKGVFTSGMEDIAKLAIIGEVNSYVILAIGVPLFILGMFAWGHYLRKGNLPLRPRVINVSA